jgi:hypothetical protein
MIFFFLSYILILTVFVLDTLKSYLLLLTVEAEFDSRPGHVSPGTSSLG